MDSKNIILRFTEEFKFEKIKNEKGKESYIISGNAQPLNEDSRNGIRYRPESVKKKYKTLNNVAFLFNHDTNKSLGHVIESGINNTHMTYRVDVDPEEKEYIRKMERGDIKHVSVGCMIENIAFNEKENIYECDVKEYVELSAVPVPGFSNTSANKEGAIFLANELGDKNILEKLKEAVKKEADEEDDDKKDKDDESDDEDDKDDKDKDEKNGDNDDEDEEEGDEDDEDEEKCKKKKGEDFIDDMQLDEKKKETIKEEGDEPTAEELLKETITRVDELFSEIDQIKNSIAVIESKIDAMNETDENINENKKNNLDLHPNKEELFKDKKSNPINSKKELEAKEKALFGESSKKVNENKEVIDMKKVRMKNIQY